MHYLFKIQDNITIDTMSKQTVVSNMVRLRDWQGIENNFI